MLVSKIIIIVHAKEIKFGHVRMCSPKAKGEIEVSFALDSRLGDAVGPLLAQRSWVNPDKI